ncbi:UPF0481 protein [Spatholobus suberectus]|nr:UPF0481 protein [Spatholobus suberectus]
MGLKIEDLMHVIRDVFLLENQLPYQLLELLWIDTNEYTLIRTMESFLRDCVSSSTIDEDLTFSDPPTHLLDLQRSIFLYQDNLRHVPVDVDTNQTQNYRKGNMAVRYRNITELKVANIILKKGKTCHPRDLSFSHYKHYLELMLPEIVVNDTTVDLMFNLTAYERCHDFENDYGICSYYSFLNSLIDHHDDVKELKLRGILLNSLRNDEEVANFFNTIGTTLVPEKGKYAHVRAQIERQYNNKSLATWLVRMRDTFFNKPFDFFMFYLAIVGTWLTAIQTWYAIREAN